MKITKAIIPAAGMGTRVLPASKAVPKEMLNIVDKPAIQYIVEEAVAAGITDILIITNRGKGVIEDHFDHAFELETKLEGNASKAKILEDVKACANLANIYFIRQKETKGLGHAVLCAKSFVGDEPFAVMYGDDVIISEDPVVGQLCRAYEKYGHGVVGVKEVPREDVPKYCSLDVTPLEGSTMAVHDIIEKPTPEEIMSCYSILGRVVLPPEVFDLIEQTPPDKKSGEVYLTDAMCELAKRGELNAVDFDGIRYDMGNKLGIMKANCEVALNHEEIGEDFKEYLKELVKTF
ncbi:MAG: UTP--glucose-1-phosphate uridylyltransferase [Oscillospiraceae bacterium]|nr:UTP--glucose-1-phosphate uridylyltransferase [Oscillospiraceae bacterium]